MLKILKLIIFIAAALGAVIFISTTTKRSSDNGRNTESKISTSTFENAIKTAPQNNLETEFPNGNSVSSVSSPVPIKPVKIVLSPELPVMKPVIPALELNGGVKEVSSKSFEELVNSSVIQLYCGNLNSEETLFANISRGTGIIIDSSGRILTNRHVIYDENAGKVKNDCFILKSPFPNTGSSKPKIYYSSQIISYPLIEKFNDIFSKDKYYNDFALLKTTTRPETNSKVNLLLGFDYAALSDYSVLENSGKFNFLPIDWDYQPKNDDFLITLGYGVDSSHLANKITSTIGKIAGNINIDKGAEPQILLIESNATTGFSGGALINPKSKGLVGLVSWITTGDATGKYTAIIFRDFLRSMMIQHLNFDLKLMPNNQ